MNEIFQLVVTLFALLLGLVAFFAVLGIFFPKRIARARLVFEASPWRALLVGVVNLLFFGALALVFASLGDAGLGQLGKIIAILLLGLPVVGMSLGLAALVQLTGEALTFQGAGLRSTAFGTAALCLASALPVIGWFILLPGLALLGLGIFILTLFSREKALADQN